MSLHEEIKLFEQRQVRSVWDDEKEQWFFSVVDVVEILTESADPKQYIKKLRSRDSELDSRWGTICTLTRMKAVYGKRYIPPTLIVPNSTELKVKQDYIIFD